MGVPSEAFGFAASRVTCPGGSGSGSRTLNHSTRQCLAPSPCLLLASQIPHHNNKRAEFIKCDELQIIRNPTVPTEALPPDQLEGSNTAATGGVGLGFRGGPGR